MPKFKLNSLSLLIASSLALSAHAEEISTENVQAENVQEETIERIFIRGTKQELTLQEVDASVELFTAERIDAERLVDIDDALLRIPNVSSTGGVDITIRGIGRAGSTGSGQGVTSNIYVDGSPLSGTVIGNGVSSLWDVQQVEVLRGSQSSIQGRNALSGAIVVSTTDPTYEPDGKFRLTAAEDSTYQIAGAYGNAIIDDQLAFRIAADYQSTDGIVDSVVFSNNTDKENRLLLRAKLLFEPEAIDDLSIKLTVDHNDLRVGNSNLSVATADPIISEAFATFNAFDLIDSGVAGTNDIETTRYILDTYYDISKHWSIKSTITNESTDLARTFGSLEFIDILGASGINTDEEDINTVELRFTFEYDHISGVIGGYYFDENETETRAQQLDLQSIVTDRTFGLGVVSEDPTGLLLAFDNETSTINRALFAQVRVDLSKSLTLDLGLRYDDERFTSTGAFNNNRSVTTENCTIAGLEPILGPNGPTDCLTIVNTQFGNTADDDLTQTVSFNAWLPKATLTYNINDDHSVFVSAQRGYRAGGVELTLVDDPNSDDPNDLLQAQSTYKPEFLNTFEIGTRSTFADGDITLNTNIFYSKYKDQQINTPGEDIQNPEDDVIINAAESTIAGVEASFTYYLNQSWDVFANVGLLKTEFDDFPFAQQGDFTNLEGNDLPNAPEVSASIGANWVGKNGLFANISAFYTGSRFSFFDNIDNSDVSQLAIDDFAESAPDVPSQLVQSVASNLTEKVDSYINVNTRFGYETDNFTVYAYVTNLFDEEVITRSQISSIDQVSGELILDSGGSSFRILPPRTFGIGIDYAF